MKAVKITVLVKGLEQRFRQRPISDHSMASAVALIYGKKVEKEEIPVSCGGSSRYLEYNVAAYTGIVDAPVT